MQPGSEPYHITADRRRGLVRMVLSGFWGDGTVVALEADYRAAVRSLGLPAGEHMVICIAGGFMVQSTQTMEALKPLLAGPAMRARRQAMVDFGALAKLQGTRLMPDATAAHFAAEAEALEWLLAKDDVG